MLHSEETTTQEQPIEMGEHKTVYVSSLDADIDEEVVALVLQFNGKKGHTISSCQGDPGPISEGGRYGHVAFQLTNTEDYRSLSELVFGELWPLVKDMWDDVRLDISCSEQIGFTGWMYFRNEAIEEIVHRLFKDLVDA